MKKIGIEQRKADGLLLFANNSTLLIVHEDIYTPEYSSEIAEI